MHYNPLEFMVKFPILLHIFLTLWMSLPRNMMALGMWKQKWS